MRLYKIVLNLLYPPKCIGCQKLLPDGETDFCPSCRKLLPAYEGAGAHGDFFDACKAPFYYEGILRESFLRFKFYSHPQYADVYGELLADYLRKEGLTAFDILTWVPVSAMRKRKRGYDQVRLLAQVVSRKLQMPLTRTLIKIRNNTAQSSLKDYSARRANVQGVYKPVKPERFCGKRILLLDDICTSGATLSESSRELLTAGAEQVTCAVLAIAQNKD